MEARQTATLSLTLRQWLLMQRLVKYAGDLDHASANDLYGQSLAQEKIVEAIANLRIQAHGHEVRDDFTEEGRLYRVIESDSYATMGVITKSEVARCACDLLWDPYPGKGDMTRVVTMTYPRILTAVAIHLEPEGSCSECGSHPNDRPENHNPGCTFFEARLGAHP